MSSIIRLGRSVYDSYNIIFSSKVGTPERHKTLIEKTGDMMLWPWLNIPGKVIKIGTDARIITVAATTLALLGNTYLFYPRETLDSINYIILLLPTIPFAYIKFAGWLATCELITGLGARTFGRVDNPALMNQEDSPEEKLATS
ncbi:MAG: hypothetical protein VX777_03985 [Chlamydiota bacterium]|nr:hypothetical protein [Chlamydiota bacterium]